MRKIIWSLVIIVVLAFAGIVYIVKKADHQLANSDVPAPTNNQSPQTQPAATGTASIVFTPTPQKAPTPPAPVTLSVYNNAALHFKFLYLNYFTPIAGDNLTTSAKNQNVSACQPYGINPTICFLLKNQPYQNTNLSSAAVIARVLPDKTTLSACADFNDSTLGTPDPKGGITINGQVFVTAVATDAGAGNFSETHFSRTLYNGVCYELDQTVRWTNAQNYSPPKQEFDRADVWGKLDILLNGFYFIK